MQGIEAFSQHFVEYQHGFGIISLKEGIHKREAVFIIQNIEVAENIMISDIYPAECNCLVEDRKSITHRTVRLMGYHMKRFVINAHSLARSHHPEILHDIVDSDPVEVVCLASGKDSRKYLMLFSSRKNEYCMGRRFFQSLQKSIECGLRQHVDLIDDIDAVPSDLRRYANLVHQGLYVLDSVVGCRIKLVDAVRTAFCKRKT